jgi:hypothetical protein
MLLPNVANPTAITSIRLLLITLTSFCIKRLSCLRDAVRCSLSARQTSTIARIAQGFV